MKKNIITIAGKPGSGKTTTAKLVAEELGYQHFSSGEMMRSIAKVKGITIEELNAIAEKDDTVDIEIDDFNRRLGEKDNIVVDSRLAFHWIPESYKVYLELDLSIAAERIVSNNDTERLKTERHDGDSKAYTHKIKNRLESEKKRYLSYYNIDMNDQSLFNLVIDTAHHTPKQAADTIVKAYTSWLA